MEPHTHTHTQRVQRAAARLVGFGGSAAAAAIAAPVRFLSKAGPPASRSFDRGGAYRLETIVLGRIVILLKGGHKQTDHLGRW